VRIHIYPARDQPRPANASAEKGCFLCDRDFVEVDTRVARVFDEEEAGKLLGFVCTDCLSKQEAIPARLRQTAEWHERFLREGQIPPALEVMVAYHASLRRRFAEEPLDLRYTTRPTKKASANYRQIRPLAQTQRAAGISPCGFPVKLTCLLPGFPL